MGPFFGSPPAAPLWGGVEQLTALPSSCSSAFTSLAQQAGAAGGRGVGARAAAEEGAAGWLGKQNLLPLPTTLFAWQVVDDGGPSGPAPRATA